MIPRAFITEWQHVAPWGTDDQIEQDLLISRIIVELFNSKLLKQNLIFRGGTALNKLYFNEPVRYSEDIDLVQRNPGPIKPIVKNIQEILDPWLGKSSTDTRRNGFRIYYSFIPESDPEGKKRIKIELNTREHFSVFPIKDENFNVDSQWFSGMCLIKTYSLNEQLGTKLRALYQRKKGRDLFDLYWAIKFSKDINFDEIIKSFKTYLRNQNLTVSRQEISENLIEKMSDRTFIHDMDPLLRADVEYKPQEAYAQVIKLIELI